MKADTHPEARGERKAMLRRERVRRYRQRQKTGAAVLRVQITDYFGLVAMLITTGWRLESEALDRRQVETAVAAMTEAAGAGQ